MKLPHFLLLCASLSASAIVLAQDSTRPMREEREFSRAGFNQQNDFSREREDRRERLDPQRPQRVQMSDEERRQLRRDVNDAGREIYRRPDR
ncbi:MAG TPA: hypothetical protein VN066_02910 [Rhodocyclaceae bacterium]|jgi:hypothetical protein|nr:hypothetical protein [Rhodocyclaceae bacterium]